ncbi:MAG: tRNA pseudouridine(38-40) synthase TruA [Pseudomonadota bacterium]|nr:tRNA pseudouridine(38-40) synthase TruA [Pseudomonadota bacterium]
MTERLVELGDAMRTIRMTLEYDGSGYRGWQRQKNGLSIQEVLEERIAIIAGERVKVIGSGRTDAGVHALGQVAHFQTACGIPPGSLLKGINSLLPDDIVVKALADAPPGFHARKDARRKTYLYRIYNGATPTALFRHWAWQIFVPLDATTMRAAATHLLGRHDFTSFCTVHTDATSFTREIYRLDIATIAGDPGPFLEIEMEADGFLRYMARTIVGTLAEIGRGKRKAAEMEDILRGRDRARAGATAPPQGLFLKEVRY